MTRPPAGTGKAAAAEAAERTQAEYYRRLLADFGDTDVVLVPTYHPAAALRGGGEVLAEMRADFVRAKEALARSQQGQTWAAPFQVSP